MRVLHHLVTACVLLIGSHAIAAAGGSGGDGQDRGGQRKADLRQILRRMPRITRKGRWLSAAWSESADLISPTTEERSDDDLLRTIHEGKPTMPHGSIGFRQDSRDVLTYIRSLSAVHRKQGGDAVGPRPCDKPNAAKPARTIRTSAEHYEGVGCPERTTRTGHVTWCTIA